MECPSAFRRQDEGRRLRSAVRRDPTCGPGRLEREALWRSPENAAEALWYRGLIFRTFADFGDGPMEYFYIPEDLPLPPPEQIAAPRQRSAPLSYVPPPPRSPRAQQHGGGRGTILAYVRDTPAPVPEGTPQEIGLPPPLLERLLLPDPPRSDLVLALVTNLGWLAADRGRWVLDNQRVGAWLRLTHWEQMSLLFTTWREMLSWNDLRRTPGLVSEGGWTNNPLLPRRAAIGCVTTAGRQGVVPGVRSCWPAKEGGP